MEGYRRGRLRLRKNGVSLREVVLAWSSKSQPVPAPSRTHERVHESMSIAGKCAVGRSSSASSYLVWTETLSTTAGWPFADLVMSVNEVCSAGRN